MEWDAAAAERKRIIGQGLVPGTRNYRAQLLLPAPELRQAACTALEQAQPIQLAEVPLAPKPEASCAKLRLTTKAGTLEIMDADRFVLDQVF